MSNISNIAVYDGASTPVLHTLTPISVTRERNKVIAVWRESLAGVPVYAQVRCTMSLEKSKTGVYRLEQRVVVPVQEVITGANASGYSAAPKVAYENTMVSIGLFHERSDVVGRRLARQLSVNIIGGVSTSVTPVQTGPAAELFDLLAAPT